jgi:multiple sugar transport system permease protein
MASTDATAPATRSRGAYWTVTRRESLEGFLYITPWIAGFLIFTAYPLISSLYLSLTQYNILEAPQFIGFANYAYAFFSDKLFWHAFSRTLVFALLNVCIGISGSLLAALLLNMPHRGTTIYRTFFFLPSVTPVVASALLWIWIFQPNIGVVNYLLGLVGVQGPAWFQSTTWAIPSVAIVALWGSIGGSRMVIFLAGLQGVPGSLYEAADLDGAGAWDKFWAVTVPMISPTIFFNMIQMVIGSMSVFSLAYIATNGGPARATYFYVYHLYDRAFRNQEMGYASALAWLFFAFLLVLTLIQFRISRNWVFYGGEVEDSREEK